MDVMKLAELKEPVSKDEDTSRTVAQTTDEKPCGWIEWLDNLLSAPPLDAND